MPRITIIIVVLAFATAASAQPVLTGDQLIDQLSLQPLRSLAGALSELQLDDPLTPAQYARIIELRQRTPALVRLGGVDDADLATIAAVLCKAPAGACTDATKHALRCLADRCEVAIAPDARTDVLRPSDCQRTRTHKRSAPLGLGFEWGTGWHRSRYPADGRAWSFGIEARLRLGRRFGTVARIDRVAGRDDGTDADDDGSDDEATGSVTRITALAGPSFAFDRGRFEDAARFLRLDLLGGYLSTRSQADESGPAAGFDLAFQLSVFRLGARVVQGFGDASAATIVIAHLGILTGSTPPEADDDEDCDAGTRRSRSRRSTSPSRLALGFEYGLLGYGLSSDLGLMATGSAVELAWYLTRRFDALARADLLLYPGYERDRTIHQAALAGIRITHARRGDSDRVGFFTTVMSGYSHGADLSPTQAGSGPIGDVSLGWGIQSPEGAANLRLHARFGIGPDNLDYRALFIAFGFELRLDERSWHD